MTTLDSSKEIQKNNPEVNEKHEDFRMFGLITFLIADGMTFAGFFAAYLTYKAVNPLPCLLYTSPSPRDMRRARMPSSA